MSRQLNASLALKESIRVLERQQVIEKDLLKEEFYLALENLNPITLLKNSIKSVVDAPSIKTDLINTAIGLVTGYIAKKIFVGDSNKGLQNLFGNAIQTLITVLITRNYDILKFSFDNIYDIIFDKKEEEE